jgi:hypothetical protein
MDENLLNLASRGGVIGLLLAIIIGGIRKWWVFGWQYDALIKDRDEWKKLALNGASTAEEISGYLVRS